MSREPKQKCFVDVYHTEDGATIYQLCVEQHGLHSQSDREIPWDCKEGNGFFRGSRALDDLIEENKATIKIVKDYRLPNED